MSDDYNRDHHNDVDVVVARTTFQHHDYLAPARHQADIVLYDAALKALQNGQIPTALMTTTTDLEVALIDTTGERAQYTQQCHGLIARHRNKSLERYDYFWERGCPDETILLDSEHAIEALAELYCRPVELGLVADVKHWDGAKLLPDQWGTEVKLHPYVQSDRATYTEPIKFEFVPPWILQQHYSIDEARDLVNAAIEARTAELNATRHARLNTSRVLGRRGCNRLDPLGRRDVPRRPHQPHFRGSKKRVQAAMLELRRRRKFYRDCRDIFRGERKDVVFAPGTVMMRKLGAYCDPLPSSRVPMPLATFPRPPNAPSTSVDAPAD